MNEDMDVMSGVDQAAKTIRESWIIPWLDDILNSLDDLLSNGELIGGITKLIDQEGLWENLGKVLEGVRGLVDVIAVSGMATELGNLLGGEQIRKEVGELILRLATVIDSVQTLMPPVVELIKINGVKEAIVPMIISVVNTVLRILPLILPLVGRIAKTGMVHKLVGFLAGRALRDSSVTKEVSRGI